MEPSTWNERARISAARAHLDRGFRFEQAGSLARALEEYRDALAAAPAARRGDRSAGCGSRASIARWPRGTCAAPSRTTAIRLADAARRGRPRRRGDERPGRRAAGAGLLRGGGRARPTRHRSRAVLPRSRNHAAEPRAGRRGAARLRGVRHATSPSRSTRFGRRTTTSGWRSRSPTRRRPRSIGATSRGPSRSATRPSRLARRLNALDVLLTAVQNQAAAFAALATTTPRRRC